jgi:hypothetical protein
MHIYNMLARGVRVRGVAQADGNLQKRQEREAEASGRSLEAVQGPWARRMAVALAAPSVARCVYAAAATPLR